MGRKWIAVAFLACIGCGTARNLHDRSDPEHGRIFGGVQSEIATLNRPPNTFRAEGFVQPESDEFHILMTGLDLPFTLIGDLVTLPYTIWWTGNHGEQSVAPLQVSPPPAPTTQRTAIEPPRIDRP